PTTYLVDTTLSNSSDSDQTVQAVRLLFIRITPSIHINHSLLDFVSKDHFIQINYAIRDLRR
ncbi:hypothetical protein, partial [Escherichia coli]|uniref:hypothetical protein n=1 Tax=Escherichia coli TaxID=562 RepID=UPI001A8C1FBC